MSRLKPPRPQTVPNRTVEVPTTSIPFLPGGLDGPPVEDPTVEIPPKGKQRADFRDEDFRRVLAQHGKYCVWRKAMLCPCLQETTQQASINCTVCDGSGFYYVDPLAIQVHMAQFEKNTKIFEKFGMWMEGTCSVSVFPDHRLGNRDSLEMRDSVMCFSELIKKGNRRGIRSTLPTDCDSARYRVVTMTRLLAMIGNAVVLLEEKVHYDITDDGWIKWTEVGKALVPDDTVLSARYEFHPVWIVISFPHSLRDDTSGRKSPKGVDRIISLPLNAAAKLDFLVNVNAAADVVSPLVDPP